MKTNRFWLMALALPTFTLPVIAGALAEFNPHQIYIDKGACPFEGCAYGEWSVEKRTTLYLSPNSEEVVAVASTGDKIAALTGEVHTLPTPVEIIYGRPERPEKGSATIPYAKGDFVYVLTYQGEGIYKVWHKGSFLSDDNIYALPGLDAKNEPCKAPSPKCWGRVTRKHHSDWWIKLKTKSGKIGWSREALHFGGNDALE